MNFDKETVGLCLKGLSTVTAGLYAGGALYVNVVEHPARMEATDASTALTCWKPSFLRAASIMAKLALTAGVSSASTYFVTRGTSKENIGWLVTSGVFISVFPITKLFIMPLNNDLIAVEKSKEKDDDWIQDGLEKWNKLHSCRTLLGIGAFTGMVFLLVKGPN